MRTVSSTSPTRNHPPEDLADVELVALLEALADPVRLEIVRQLAERSDCSCGELELPIAKSTTTHHLKALANAGVIKERDQGTRKFLSLRCEEMEARFPGLLDSVVSAVKNPD
jgi:DNA-binding transcriptional ArsR family regulator